MTSPSGNADKPQAAARAVSLTAAAAAAAPQRQCRERAAHETPCYLCGIVADHNKTGQEQEAPGGGRAQISPPSHTSANMEFVTMLNNIKVLTVLCADFVIGFAKAPQEGDGVGVDTSASGRVGDWLGWAGWARKERGGGSVSN